MDADPSFDQLLQRVVRALRAIGEPTRLRLVCALGDGESSVTALAAAAGAPHATVSRQLQVLHEAGVVRRRRDGAHVLYRVTDPILIELCSKVARSVGSPTINPRVAATLFNGDGGPLQRTPTSNRRRAPPEPPATRSRMPRKSGAR